VEAAFAQIQGRPEEAMSLVYRHLHADGGIRWVDAWLSHRMEDPQIGGRDQPARRHVARRVRPGAAGKSGAVPSIVETAQERIWVADPQGRTVYVNQKMADIADRSTEELYFRGILELLDVDDSTMLSRRLLERRTAGTEEYELRLRHHAAGVRFALSAGRETETSSSSRRDGGKVPEPWGQWHRGLAMTSGAGSVRRRCRRAPLRPGVPGTGARRRP
jgi:PAS domain S-box-containing protein